MGDHIIRLDKGTVAATGTVAEVLGPPHAMRDRDDSFDDIGATPMPELRRPR
jgi:hypothetical protein